MSAKKRLILIVGLTVGLGLVMLLNFLNPNQVLQSMTADEVSTITVELLPSDTTFLVDEDDVETMMDLIHALDPGRPTFSQETLVGQTVTITVLNNRGTELTVEVVGNSALKINGTAYTVSYETCEALSEFANSLAETE